MSDEVGPPPGGDSLPHDDLPPEEEDEEEEVALLNADHPLLARVQRALLEQLEKQRERVRLQLGEKREELKKLIGHRENIGMRSGHQHQELRSYLEKGVSNCGGGIFNCVGGMRRGTPLCEGPVGTFRSSLGTRPIPFRSSLGARFVLRRDHLVRPPGDVRATW